MSFREAYEANEEYEDRRTDDDELKEVRRAVYWPRIAVGEATELETDYVEL